METSIHHLTLADICGPANDLKFDDPHGICKIGPGRMAAFQTVPLDVMPRVAGQLVGVVDGRAVGSIMFFPGELVVDGQLQAMLWGSSLYVDPSSRNTLMGIMLIMELQRLFCVVGISHVSSIVYPIYKKLGWMDMPMARYVLLRKSRSVLERFLGPGRQAALLRPVVDGALLIHRCFLEIWGRMAASGVYCKQVESVPASMDRLLDEKVGAFGFHRSSSWLNWMLGNSFDSDPRNTKRLYFVFDRRDNLIAYFVTKAKFYEEASHRGFTNVYLESLLDWMIFDDSAVSEEIIWLMATNLLGAWGVDAVEICSNRTDAGAKLKPLGFRRTGEVNFLFTSDANGPVIEESQAPHWRLRQIDGDEGLG